MNLESTREVEWKEERKNEREESGEKTKGRDRVEWTKMIDWLHPYWNRRSVRVDGTFDGNRVLRCCSWIGCGVSAVDVSVDEVGVVDAVVVSAVNVSVDVVGVVDAVGVVVSAKGIVVSAVGLLVDESSVSALGVAVVVLSAKVGVVVSTKVGAVVDAVGLAGGVDVDTRFWFSLGKREVVLSLFDIKVEDWDNELLNTPFNAAPITKILFNPFNTIWRWLNR